MTAKIIILQLTFRLEPLYKVRHQTHKEFNQTKICKSMLDIAKKRAKISINNLSLRQS